MAKQRKTLTTALWVVLLITIVGGIYVNWVGLKLVISQGWKVWITSKWAIAAFIDTPICLITLVALGRIVGKEQKNTSKD